MDERASSILFVYQTFSRLYSISFTLSYLINILSLDDPGKGYCIFMDRHLRHAIIRFNRWTPQIVRQ